MVKILSHGTYRIVVIVTESYNDYNDGDDAADHGYRRPRLPVVVIVIIVLIGSDRFAIVRPHGSVCDGHTASIFQHGNRETASRSTFVGKRIIWRGDRDRYAVHIRNSEAALCEATDDPPFRKRKAQRRGRSKIDAAEFAEAESCRTRLSSGDGPVGKE